MPKSRITSGIFPAVIVLSTLTSSCFFQKTRTVFTPPPPQSQPGVPAAAPTLPGPPEIAGDPNATLPPETPNSVPEAPGPPAVKPATKKNAGTTPPKPATPAPAAEQTAPPRLGPIFTPEQRRDFTRTLDESLESVRRMLEVLATKNLNAEQSDTRVRITTYQKQAEQQRDQDLALAVNLATRAKVLAQDLLERLQ